MQTRTFISVLVLMVCLAGSGSCCGQSLEQSLTEEYPQYAADIQRLFDQNPRYIQPTVLDNSMPYSIRFGISHSIGDGVGNPASYTTLESFLPLWDDGGNGIVFLNPLVHLENFGNVAANIGLGARQLVDAGTPTVLGVSAWYDYRRSDVGEYDYNQVSLGLEYLNDWFEIRGNIYIPDVSTDRRPLPNRLGGNSLLLDRAEVAMAGVDAEIGTVLPSLGNLQSRIAVGFYHYEDPDVATVTGWRVRSELATHENLATDLTVSKDDVFGTTLVLRLTLHSLLDMFDPPGNAVYPPIYAFRRGENSHISNSVADRLGERVRRNQFIVTGIDDGDPAVNPTTMMPYVFLFAAPGSTGNGTFENPFETISAAMADNRSGQAITYTPFGGTFAEDVVMTDGSTLLSNAFTQSLDTQFGMVELPFSGVGSQSPLAASIMGSLTVASNSEVDGFEISGGVIGTAISDALIERNSIGNPGGDGISLTSLANFAGSEVVIQNNTILSGVTDGISLSGTDVAATIQNNTVEDGAINGIRFTDGNIVATISDNTANQTTMNGLLVQAARFTGTVTNNTFEMGTVGGIFLDLTTEFRGAIDNNMVRNNGAEGIFLGSPLIANTNGTSNATISGNDASGSVTGIGLVSANPLIDITGNMADNTSSFGLGSLTETYLGTISGNQFNSGSGFGINLTTTSAFAGTVSGNTANNNTGGSGIFMDVLTMDGTISNNTANMNAGDGILVGDNQVGFMVGFSGTVEGNTTTSNTLNGLSIFGVNSTFSGSLRNNTAMSNTLSGIRYQGAVFQSNIETNTGSSNGVNGIELMALAFNGALLQNTAGNNAAAGISVRLEDTVAAASVVDAIGNQISGNNINATTMVTGSQFRLENSGPGSILVLLDGNTSTDTVIVPAFNFDLLNTGSGSVTETVVLPSTATGTVGRDGMQVFPVP